MIRILGLQYGKKYSTTSELNTLRYGCIMMMADQDQDGSHIKGLIINFIHHNWPDLLRHGFIVEFITPIVKVSVPYGYDGSTTLLFLVTRSQKDSSNALSLVCWSLSIGNLPQRTPIPGG